jgi:uncharacterized protein YodC (DUF2158 family)
MSKQSVPFKVGDVVRLRSGGPDMTVIDVIGTRVGCQWHTSAIQPEDGSFISHRGFEYPMLTLIHSAPVESES